MKYEQGDIEGAIKHWQEAIAIDGEQAEPQLAVAVALYKQGNREEGLKLGESALTLDSRYADLEFLAENLWGDRLIADTKAFLSTPQIKALLTDLPLPEPTSSE